MEIEPKVKKLRLYNLLMGCLHLLQAIIILAMSTDFKLPVTTAFLGFDEGTGKLQPVTETLFDLQIGPVIALFLLLSAIAHFTLTLPSVFPWYARNIKKGINYARWYEYSLSASVMIIIIAMLSGVYDLASLILVFSLTAVMNLCGLIMEVHNQKTDKTSWLSFNIGSFAGLMPWVAIAIYFFGSTSNADGSVPTFVYFILPTLFVFFFTFALNMVLQYKKVGPWRDYIFGERMYVILSLVAKSALAWQVFFGTLRPV